MKKRKIEKKNIKFIIIGLITGCIIAGCGVYAATYINAENVSYTNTTSGLSATNVQDALDEAYSKSDVRNKGNFISMYKYNASTCVTGEESTCVATKCYANYYAPTCSRGDIVKYKVNDTDIVTFHVIADSGTTLTMQAQKNTVSNVPWLTEADSSDGVASVDEGPLTAVAAVEHATNGWTNVNDMTYTMGDSYNYTYCTSYDSCKSNQYTWSKRTAKARLIKVQEAASLGCTNATGSCPIWMFNYLYGATSYGATINDSSKSNLYGDYIYGYWTMNAYSTSTASTPAAYRIGYYGGFTSYAAGQIWIETNFAARAVVEVHKQGYGNNA